MARKSRKNSVLEQGQLVAATQTVDRYKTAVYVRLSVENSGKDDDGAAIETQKEVCLEYIKECPYLELCEVYEDNGHTGTDFSRPGFNRLMDDVRVGRIECIVVRDLSRFGRNYIETGTFLERIFPKLGIRFISVKEQYDSFATDGSCDSLAIPLQNLINDYYSKDISRKVSAALKVRMENGTYTWHNPPFGYKWGEDTSRIVPYEPYAEYVREIFRRFLAGTPKNQIRKWLAENDVPTGCELNGRRKGTKWTCTVIRDILSNPAYTGDKVHGRVRSALYMGVKGQKVEDPAEWVVYKDDHDALVSHEDFDRVQEILRRQAEESAEKREQTSKERANIIDLLAGKIYCHDCGGRIHFQRRRGKKTTPYYGVYECLRYRSSHYQECTQHYINQKKLYKKIVDALKTQTEVALNYERLIEKLQYSDAVKKRRDELNADIQSIRLKLKGLSNKRAALYENYTDGVLNEEEYSYAKHTYGQEAEKLNRMLDEAVERKKFFIETMSADNRWISNFKRADRCTELNQKIVDALIERIEVCEGGDFILTMKYQDVYVLTKRYVSELGEEAVI